MQEQLAAARARARTSSKTPLAATPPSSRMEQTRARFAQGKRGTAQATGAASPSASATVRTSSHKPMTHTTSGSRIPAMSPDKRRLAPAAAATEEAQVDADGVPQARLVPRSAGGTAALAASPRTARRAADAAQRREELHQERVRAVGERADAVAAKLARAETVRQELQAQETRRLHDELTADEERNRRWVPAGPPPSTVPQLRIVRCDTPSRALRSLPPRLTLAPPPFRGGLTPLFC